MHFVPSVGSKGIDFPLGQGPKFIQLRSDLRIPVTLGPLTLNTPGPGTFDIRITTGADHLHSIDRSRISTGAGFPFWDFFRDLSDQTCALCSIVSTLLNLPLNSGLTFFRFTVQWTNSIRSDLREESLCSDLGHTQPSKGLPGGSDR